MSGRARVVIYNPAAGRADRLDAIRDAFDDRGVPTEWLETRTDEPGLGLARNAVEAGAEVVTVAGGDGTVRSCLEALIGTDVSLAILPLGTGNLLALNLGIPLDPVDAVDVAMKGIPRRIDIGMANGEPFTVMAGMGLDADMIRDATPGAKSRFGALAYVGSLFRHLRRRRVDVTLHIDDGERARYRSTMVLLGIVGQLQGGVKVFPDARIAGGKLHVLVVEARGWIGWLDTAGRVLFRRPGRHLHRHTARRVIIETDPPEVYEVDGEVRGETARLELEVLRDAVRVLVPPGS